MTTLWRAQLLSPECLQLLLGLNPASIKVNTTFSSHLSQCICGHYAWVIPNSWCAFEKKGIIETKTKVQTVFAALTICGNASFHQICSQLWWKYDTTPMYFSKCIMQLCYTIHTAARHWTHAKLSPSLKSLVQGFKECSVMLSIGYECEWKSAAKQHFLHVAKNASSNNHFWWDPRLQQIALFIWRFAVN